jgi:hypothetical protein
LARGVGAVRQPPARVRMGRAGTLLQGQNTAAVAAV